MPSKRILQRSVAVKCDCIEDPGSDVFLEVSRATLQRFCRVTKMASSRSEELSNILLVSEFKPTVPNGVVCLSETAG